MNFKTRTEAGLEDPDFLLVGCVAIGQCLLKIRNSGSYKKYIFDSCFNACMRINIQMIATDDRISFSIKSHIKISFCQEVYRRTKPEIIRVSDCEPRRCQFG